MHFEVYRKTEGQRSDRVAGTTKPLQYPCFELVFNYGWNDYDVFSWFSLWYFFDSESDPIHLGEVKIIDRENNNTFDTVPRNFDYALPDNFCSLGMDISYYKNLLKLNKLDRSKLLLCLRDIGIWSRIYEEFAEDSKLELSLLRDMASRQALSHAKFILSGRPPEEAYSFTFNLSEIENINSNIVWNVTLPFEANEWSRLIGVIGDNGVGKTFLLRNLVQALYYKETDKFQGKLPLFDNLFVISSSKYDQYKSDDGDIKCNETFHITSLDNTTSMELIEDLKGISHRKKTIHSKAYVEVFHDLLKNCIGEQIDCLFSYQDEELPNGMFYHQPYIDTTRLSETYDLLSSGQRHILHMMTSLFSHIHMSSLVVIDEPEVHLHPKALIEFMDALQQTMVLFDSFAIIATHSPLIVREIITSNVYRMVRQDEDNPSIAKVHFNTFGEDIALLYARIFHYDEDDSIFTRLISQRASKFRSADKLINFVENNIGEIGLNARMRIIDIFNRSHTDA